MLNINTLKILFLTINLTISLKSDNFCFLKKGEEQQLECKGYYDYQQNYHTKCEPIKCHGKLSYQCGSKMCSNNKTECNFYNYVNYYLGILFEATILNPELDHKFTIEKRKIDLFNKYIKICQNEIYKLSFNDFCVNGNNCNEKKKILNGFGYNYFIKQIDCKCPSRQSFKCGKYCATNSIACDYYKSNENQFNRIINDCGNNNITTFRPYFTLW